MLSRSLWRHRADGRSRLPRRRRRLLLLIYFVKTYTNRGGTNPARYSTLVSRYFAVHALLGGTRAGAPNPVAVGDADAADLFLLFQHCGLSSVAQSHCCCRHALLSFRRLLVYGRTRCCFCCCRCQPVFWSKNLSAAVFRAASPSRPLRVCRRVVPTVSDSRSIIN